MAALPNLLKNFVSPKLLQNGNRMASASLSTSSFRPDKMDDGNPQVKLFTKEQARAFMGVFPDIVRELTIENVYKDMPTVNKHLSKCIQYTVPNGKKNRGMAVPISYKMLVPKSELTDENVRLSIILGWCVEFLQAFFLVADDIMDGSETRRGQPAWYKKESVGMIAINDALLLEQCVYALLQNHFSDKPYYLRMLDEFHQTTRHTCMGQSLDLLTPNLRGKDGRIDLDSFNMKTNTSIIKFKTSYYTFCLPGCLAMIMAGHTDEKLFQNAKTIYLEMGRFFQVQDDFLDCYGDPKVTGKIGTDIQDGKCTWLIALAMQRASKEQKEILKDCYGKHEEDKIAKVKEIYDDLNLKKQYKKFENHLHDDIILQIKQIKGEGQLLPPQLFTTFLDRLYEREK